jgi:hypothetical protein
MVAPANRRHKLACVQTHSIAVDAQHIDVQPHQRVAEIQEALPQTVAGGVLGVFGPQQGGQLSPGQCLRWLESQQGEKRARLPAVQQYDVARARSGGMETPEEIDAKGTEAVKLPCHGA